MIIQEAVISGGTKDQVDRLKFIFATPKGSVPFERDIGIDFNIVDLPMEVAKAKLIEAYVIAARKYVKAEIGVSFKVENEKLTPKVVIK